MKPKKCKQCGELFTPTRPLESVCGFKCAMDRTYDLNLKKKEKAVNDKVKDMKESLMKRSDYVKLFQIVFNSYIRERDKELPCVSCGRFKVDEWHAGHYIASTYQYHRFNPSNVHKQCNQCNTHFRGNLIPYRIELIKRIGLEEVEYIENTRHMMLEITIPELRELIIEYKLKTKQLKR